MTDNSDDFTSNFIHGYVYEGVWKNYNAPILKRWIWTLPNLRALFVLACLGLLFSYTQSRAWVILRYLIYLRKRSIRLGGDTSSDPVEHLSQVSAIKDVLPFIKHHVLNKWALCRNAFRVKADNPNMRSNKDFPLISPLFGVSAIINIAIFVVLNVAIPWLVSDGISGSPIVRSKLTNNCLYDPQIYTQSLAKLQKQKVEAIFLLCENRLDQECIQKYQTEKPRISKRRLKGCIFPGNVCHNHTQPFEITHSDITVRNMGINMRSNLIMNHRLSCSPISLDAFLLFNLTTQHLTNISLTNKSLVNITTGHLPWLSYYSSLLTMNGPNYYSNESSGKLYSMMSGPQALSVLPEMRVEEISRRGYNYIDTIHEDLRREDGMPFLILYRAGSYMHPHQVDDPFFAAHTEGLTINHNGEKDVRNYYPDHEATALGCVEQYQYCISKASFCTSWGYLVDDLHTLGKHLKDDYLQSKEVLYQALIRNQLSVHGYLYSYASRMAKLESSHVTTQYQTSEATISNESWVTEVEIWFMKTILISIFNIQTQVRYSMANDPWYYLDFDTWRNRPVLCDLILFHDAGYTNINFVSFWIATALLVFLCIISYTIKWLHNTSKDIFTRLWGMTPR